MKNTNFLTEWLQKILEFNVKAYSFKRLKKTTLQNLRENLGFEICNCINFIKIKWSDAKFQIMLPIRRNKI